MSPRVARISVRVRHSARPGSSTTQPISRADCHQPDPPVRRLRRTSPHAARKLPPSPGEPPIAWMTTANDPAQTDALASRSIATAARGARASRSRHGRQTRTPAPIAVTMRAWITQGSSCLDVRSWLGVLDVGVDLGVGGEEPAERCRLSVIEVGDEVQQCGRAVLRDGQCLGHGRRGVGLTRG